MYHLAFLNVIFNINFESDNLIVIKVLYLKYRVQKITILTRLNYSCVLYILLNT